VAEKHARGCVLVVGATSAIGRAVARRWAAAGNDLVLAARDLEELRIEAGNISMRSTVKVETARFDALDFGSHGEMFAAAERLAGGLDVIVVCHGYMVPQAEAARDPEESRRVIDVNFTSAVSVLNRAADYFEGRKRGLIVAITSVAGDRGRQSNYIYGSAKAGLQTYLQGLRHCLAKSKVKVVDVRPGFVDTGMTWGLPGVFLAASPERVARDVFRAARRGRSVVYTPWFWRWIMAIIRRVPQFVFHRTKL
jgi:decaprenylphospho-beta-D-erythro-pentofuranosid-2-ulose 2-reductase